MTEPADRVVEMEATAETIPGTKAARIEAVSSVEELVAAREASRLGASDVAAKLGMANKQIDALERGDWQALPGQAFVRGALRSYGKTIGVSVEPLLASLAGQVRAPELRASASLDAPMPRGGAMSFDSSGSLARIGWILLGVIAVVAMLFYFSRPIESRDAAATFSAASPGPRGGERLASQDGSLAGSGAAGTAVGAAPTGGGARVGDPGAAAGATNGASGQLAPLTPLAPLQPLSPSGGPAGAPGSSGPAGASGSGASSGSSGPAAGGASSAPAGPGPSAPSSGSAGAAIAPGTPASSASAGGGAGQAGSQSTQAGASGGNSPPPADGGAAVGAETVRLRFERESWVDIREAGGNILLYGIQPAGSSRELTGRKPLTLTIGNSQHVTLERAGKQVDLGPRSRQGVARFTLE